MLWFRLLIVWNWTRVTLALWNCAQWKPTFQSSDYIEPAFRLTTGNSKRAVDGNRSPYLNTTCSHTDGEKLAWWMVDLQGQYPVKQIMVTNRLDCCGERLRNFRIELFKTDPRHHPKFPDVTGEICAIQDNSTLPSGDNFFNCAPGVVGRFARLVWQRGHIKESLTICEFEVLVDLVYSRNLRFDKFYNVLARHTAFLTLTSVDLKRCSLECTNRRDMELCTAFNWSPELLECRLMSVRPQDKVGETNDARWILYRITAL